jgi:hypothetical protein
VSTRDVIEPIDNPDEPTIREAVGSHDFSAREGGRVLG